MTTTIARAPAHALVEDASGGYRPQAESLAGLGTMVRLFVRRNRVRLVVWFAVIVGLFAYVGDYYKSLFTTQKALDDFALISDTPGIKALTGLAAAPATLGGAVWTKIWMTCAITLALGVIFLVTRSGRADEELGRTELLRSRRLGQHAYSVAVWLVLAVLCVAIGLGVSLSSIAVGLDPAGAGTAGSWVVGASLGGIGLLSIGIGALTGQLASTARGANSLGSVIVVAFYVLRMVGDLSDGTLTWLSPIGWGQHMGPWGPNRWWPLALILGLAAVLLVVAWLLEERRDLGAGVLPDRAGPAGAPTWYAAPLGLAVRLQRAPLIAWALGVMLGGALLGSVVRLMNRMLEDSGATIPILRGVGIDSLISLLGGMLGLIVAAFALQSATQLRADEATGIIEPQLAGALSRTRWALSRLAIPIVGSAVLLAVGGWIMGAVYAASVDDPAQTVRVAGAVLVFWPAVMVLVGIAVLLFGFLPRLAVALTWAVLAAMYLVMIIGDALHLPDWLLRILPFSATPQLPGTEMDWQPVIVMTLVAAAMIAAGLAWFARRDITPA